MNAHQRRIALRVAVRANTKVAGRQLTRQEVTATCENWWWGLDAIGYLAVTRDRHAPRRR